MIGKTILHYHILEKLGEGGMGIVYLAQDTKLKRKVAIKFLPRHIASDADVRKRFEIEAKAAAALNHGNIATVYEINEQDDSPFIVMEYVPGQTLNHLIEKGPFKLEEAISITIQIAEGLKAAHLKDIVHRDIKSTNIMLTEKGRVKIMDFGLARIGAGAELTQFGSTLGTVAYMSPEQARGLAVDHQTDIWSFGVVLYAMLTNEMPFMADYEQAIIYAILNEAPLPLTHYHQDVDEKITSLVNGCLQKNKQDRFQDFGEIIDRLTEYRDISSSRTIIVKEPTPLLRKPLLIVALALMVLAVVFFFQSFQKSKEQDQARSEILPQVEALVGEIPGTGEGPKPWQSYNLLKTIANIIPNDPLYKSLYDKTTRKVIFKSEPEAVKIYARAYSDSSENWLYVGESPLDSFPLPVGFSILKFDKPGYQTAFDLIWNVGFISDTMPFNLIEANKAPEKMAYISKDASWFAIKAAPASLHFPGLEQIEMVQHGDFFMDIYEVSNAEYKAFVDAGGYRNPDYWKIPFSFKDRQMDFEEAMNLFTDRTGRSGPASWEVGDYPDGQAELPVSGVSWFEAAAYAEFKGKSLPTLFHWDRAAFTWASPEIVPASNLGSKMLIPANSKQSINRFGVYNLAGNVREWCYNQSSRDDHFILGGGWDDPPYGFNDAFAQSPFDRSATNGFRCIKYIEDDNKKELALKIELPWRDFLNEKPVSDQTFSFYLKQFAYDKARLNAQMEETEENTLWTRQRVSFDAAYGGERMLAYVFLPKNSQPPYQTIIYFPGSGSMHRRSSAALKPNKRIDFFLKSGRAFVWPIYKSTYERGDDLDSDYPEMTNFWKDHVIMWTKDFSRSIDYLETRDDIISDQIVYFGASWGGAMGGVIPAVEKRIKGAILLVAGLQFQRTLPEVEPVNYLPRITVPVLMLNGKYDFFFPYESSQLPFFKLLGTKEKDKQIFVYDGGHTVPATEMAREAMSWLDQYFGQVQ